MKEVQKKYDLFKSYQELYEKILSGHHTFRVALIRDLDEEERVEAARIADEQALNAVNMMRSLGMQGQIPPASKPKNDKFYTSVEIPEILAQKIVEYILPDLKSQYEKELAKLKTQIGEISLESNN